MAGMLGLVAVAPPAAGQQVRLSTATLRDRIRGGWAGQTVGVTFGGQTELVYTGTMIEDYQPIVWYDGYLKDTYEMSAGLPREAAEISVTRQGARPSSARA
jgi:hypothetical protein